MGVAQSGTAPDASTVPPSTESDRVTENTPNPGNGGNILVTNGHNQQPSAEGEGRLKKKSQFQGKGRGIGAVPKGRGSPAPGWTGAGFDA